MRALIALSIAIWLAAPGPAGADVPPGWRLVTFDGLSATDFKAREDGAIAVIADDSSAMLVRSLDAASARRCLAWRWRVDSGLGPSDLTVKGADDRPVGVILGFPWDGENASLGERLRRPMVEAEAGADAPGRFIAYVFGGDAPRGAMLDNPYFRSSGMTKVLRSAADREGRWYAETVDWRADYRAVFGTDPKGPPVELALVGDADDLDRRSVAVIDGPAFTGRCPAG